MISKIIPILMYHSLDPVRFPNKMSVRPETFKKQMRLISKFFRAISLEEAFRRDLKEGLFGNRVAVTFDDGYADNYLVAYPILKELGISATFFVLVDKIGEKGFMTWKMLEEMSRTPGIEIASHGLMHQAHSELTEEQMVCSICESKKILEKRLNFKIKSFCYPLGSLNREVLQKVKEAGYLYGCGATSVPRETLEEKHFSAKRIKISETSASSLAFAIRLSGFYNLFK